jgi:hypothetical protein
MVNERQQEPLEWQRQAWLSEYQACQSHHDSISTEFWAVTAIIMSLSTALLGGIIFAILSKKTFNNIVDIELTMKFLICAVGLGMIFILIITMFWLKRLQFLQRVFQKRMREIEEQLGMRKNWLTHGLDITNLKTKCDESDIIPAYVKDDVASYARKFISRNSFGIFSPIHFFNRYERPLGSQIMFLIFSIGIIFWIALIIAILGLTAPCLYIVPVALFLLSVAFVLVASDFN